MNHELDPSEALWASLESDLSFARTVLGLKLETQEDAIFGDRTSKRFRFRRDPEIKKQQQHALRAGREALGRIDKKITDGEFDDILTQQFAKLFFNVGFLVACAELPSDDMSRAKNWRATLGHKTVGDHRIWFARQMLPLLDGGNSRKEAEEMFVRTIKGRLESSTSDDQRNWLKAFLDERGFLKTTYGARQLSKSTLAALAKKRTRGLPPDV